MSSRFDRATGIVAGFGVLLLTVTACGESEPGTAAANPAAATAAADQQKVGGLPQRTKEVRLDGVDPCTLLTEAQLDELKVNSKPRLDEEPRDGPTCAFDVDLNEPYYGYAIETITGADLEAWVTGDRKKPSMTREPIEVEGFPALNSYKAGSATADCETLVGTASGQTLRVQMMPLTDDAFDQQQQCDMSKRVATLAVQNLNAGK